MSRDHIIGSARDPNVGNRQTRTKIESAVKQALHAAGLRRMTALEAASDLAITYLTKGNNKSLQLVRHLAGDDIAEGLEQLRQTASEDHP
ncbi:hypothetical protein [Kribbella sp. DT2]|uniref:hypothetical protein n=1 Tax=Kribbella sp. DT2 TaxID=3393427 RepID=UPI003CEA75A0